MSNNRSEQFQAGRDSLQDGKGDRPIPEAVKPTQADQQPSEEAHELSDDQLESVVGGRKTSVIHVIGFEN